MHLAGIALFALLAVVTPQPSQPTDTTDLVQVAKIATEYLEQGDYAAVVALFNPRLREKLPEAEVRKMWDAVHERAGRLRSASAPITSTKDNLRRVIVPAQFEKAKMQIEWVFTDDGQIAGILLHGR